MDFFILFFAHLGVQLHYTIYPNKKIISRELMSLSP